MVDQFRVVDVTSWEVVDAESLGRNPKLWLREPGGADDRQRDWLFKPVVIPSTGHRQGEDWAEKVVCELARLVAVPCADVELASRGDQRGSISRNVVPSGWSLELGPLLLGTVVEDYRGTAADATGRMRPIPGRPGHSIENIYRALSGCGTPLGSGDGNATETFASYLLLDAWVANQDRHDQNWAALRPPAGSGGLRLAPSFDHASSVGFNLTDARRRSILDSGGLEHFAERGRAQRFEHDPAAAPAELSTLVEFAHRAMSIAGAEVAERLLGRLRAVLPGEISAVISGIPELSEVTARFILEFLDVNRRRLLRVR